MKRLFRIAACAAGLALAGCGGEETGAGGLTADESRQLNEAAEMLDLSSDNLVADQSAPGGDEWMRAESGAAAAPGEGETEPR